MLLEMDNTEILGLLHDEDSLNLKVQEAVRVLEVVSAASSDIEIKIETHQFGGAALDAVGEPLPAATLKACEEADAIILGA